MPPAKKSRTKRRRHEGNDVALGFPNGRAKGKTAAVVEGILAEDVAFHSSSDDCWVVLRRTVLDVTNFANEHPGTAQALLKRAGCDVTPAFERVGHRADRTDHLIDKYAVGKLADGETVPVSPFDDPNAKSAAPPASWWSRNVWSNEFVWMWLASFAITFLVYLISNLGEPGFGRFQIVGFRGVLQEPRVSEYAYKLQALPDGAFGVVTAVLPWVLYAAHNLAVLGILFVAQRSKPGYSNDWRWFNWAMLKVNAVAYVVKLAQTSYTYNGLSAVLPLWFGTATVATYLILVTVIRLRDRGIFFGFGRNFVIHRALLTKELSLFARRYHGFVISTMIINDFWFHPFEGTPGHMMGILNDTLLLWQMVAIYRPAHRNALWTLAIELIVLPHSATIALNRDAFTRANVNPDHKGISGMFGFGYLLILAVTQIWNIGRARWSRWALRISVALVFFTSAILTYALWYGFRFLWQIVSIPMISYGLFFFFVIAFALFSRAVNACTQKGSSTRAIVAAIVSVSVVAASFVPYYFILGN